MPTLVLAEPHGSVLHEAGQAAVANSARSRAAQRCPGASPNRPTRARPYAGVPVLAIGRAAAGAAAHAAGRTGRGTLRDGAWRHSWTPRAAGRNLRRAAGARCTQLDGFHRGAGLHTGAPDRAAKRCTGAHLDGAPPGHDAGRSGQRAARWRGAALGHGRRAHRGRASLLHERAPREMSRLQAEAAQRRSRRRCASRADAAARCAARRACRQPTHLLSNGRYSVALRANGAGRSRFGSSDITRWRDDALRDAHGSFFCVRRAGPRCRCR